MILEYNNFINRIFKQHIRLIFEFIRSNHNNIIY